ncbi:hypothetical protein AZE42_01068 [Rhizopogon vesiculosus]|uniref:Uncharacterized protein n=1 Tax=Rhizopogon vesiculosus TaxID=180088 RepID=A0A1J8QEY6_9AGAM|nr:hypothetical protein AZE42_01068 [Rhizopogon vesiculosus]
MSDEATRASCFNWSIGKSSELSTFRDHAPNAATDATPDLCKYDDENDNISDIDSDSDDVVC